MLLGVIADDFTGASDIANTLAQGLPGEGGLRTVQFLGVPEAGAPQDAQAGVVALKSRGQPPDEAVQQSLAALAWLQSQGCQQFVFKYCSTFDSTRRGNIGPVGEALADALGMRGVVACPAFPGSGRTVYLGHLFINGRLLNESGMQDHPVNPMTDADIRRWLSLQCAHPVGLIPLPQVRLGAESLRRSLAEAGDRGEVLVIVDGINDEDLNTIGSACAEARLISGGSGIARALPRNFIARGQAVGSRADTLNVAGPEAILAGSCAGATREQIVQHKTHHPTLQIDVEAVMRNTLSPERIATFLLAQAGRAPLAYSSGDPEHVRSLQARYGRERLSFALDALFGATARLLLERGLRRLVVAGGETAGAVVSALALGPLRVGPEIDPGIPILYSTANTRRSAVALALKSGNFGGADFFAKALNRMAGAMPMEGLL